MSCFLLILTESTVQCTHTSRESSSKLPRHSSIRAESARRKEKSAAKTIEQKLSVSFKVHKASSFCANYSLTKRCRGASSSAVGVGVNQRVLLCV
jgi:hypothetical protein